MSRVKVGDIELNVVEQGQGIPLLLVHGFPLDHSMWKVQIEAFSASYRVIAPDLRGQGYLNCIVLSRYAVRPIDSRRISWYNCERFHNTARLRPWTDFSR